MTSNKYKTYIISDEWRAKSRNVRDLTNNHCVLFPWMKANHAHHLTYQNMENEIPVRDIIPLSKTAHSIVHWRIFWKTRLRIWMNLILRLLAIFWISFWFLVRAVK